MNRHVNAIAGRLSLRKPIYGYCGFAKTGPPTRRDETTYPALLFKRADVPLRPGSSRMPKNEQIFGRNPLRWAPSSPSLFAHQVIPRASQGAFDPACRCNEDVDLPGLDSLDIPNVQVHFFGQFFLGEPPGATLTTNVLAELLDEFLHWERHNGASSATDWA
jgi:hypothetical protein